MRHKSKLPCDTAATQPPLTDTEDGGERETRKRKGKTGRQEGEDGGMDGETGKINYCC